MLIFGLSCMFSCSSCMYLRVFGAPASHLRLKYLKHALSNVYLASFLGLVDTFTRSTDAQLVVSY